MRAWALCPSQQACFHAFYWLPALWKQEYFHREQLTMTGSFRVFPCRWENDLNRLLDFKGKNLRNEEEVPASKKKYEKNEVWRWRGAYVPSTNWHKSHPTCASPGHTGSERSSRPHIVFAGKKRGWGWKSGGRVCSVTNRSLLVPHLQERHPLIESCGCDGAGRALHPARMLSDGDDGFGG